MLEKLGESKVAIRQAVQKIIRTHFAVHRTPYWIEFTLKLLQERNPIVKEEALTLLTSLYQ
jgi:hypothetical protein